MKIKCEKCGKIFNARKGRKWCNQCNLNEMFGSLTKEMNKLAKKELKS